jgi:DUF4097 and DUF4098 domain-containing protein YvlB
MTLHQFRAVTLSSAVALSGLVALAAPAAAHAGLRETERVDRTAQIRAGGTLTLKNFSGHVNITGSNRGDVAIHAIRHGTRDRLDHIKLDVEESGSDVTIEANRRDSGWHDHDNTDVVETDFDIEVPSDVGVSVNVFASDVTVKDVRGSQHVKTFSGAIDLSGGEKTINAETFSGDINVRMPQGAAASVDFNSFSGELRADVPMTYRSSSRTRVHADIGAGGSDYSFKTFSGDVRIR